MGQPVFLGYVRAGRSELRSCPRLRHFEQATSGARARLGRGRGGVPKVLRWPRTWRAYSVRESAKTGGGILSHWGGAGRPVRTCFAASRLASHLSALIPPNQQAMASVIQSNVERRN
jgi:hypothetical protein